jgi:hypothetical protein
MNPACRKAEARPVQAKTAGIRGFFGSMGHPSMTLAPCCLASSTHAVITVRLWAQEKLPTVTIDRAEERDSLVPNG